MRLDLKAMLRNLESIGGGIIGMNRDDLRTLLEYAIECEEVADLAGNFFSIPIWDLNGVRYANPTRN